MVKETPMKHSNRNNKENNGTLYQYFALKKPASDIHDQLSANNEKQGTSDTSSNDAKQQKKTILTANDNINGATHQRKPLNELATMTLNTKSTTHRQKPAKPSFVVLRDNNSQEQGATEAQQQDQHDNISTLPTTQSQFNTQSVPLVDALDSQTSITSSPLALELSQDSFLGPDGIEFRVDALDNDDSDQNGGNNEYHCYDNNADSPFFDDLDQLQVEDTHPYPQWWPHDTGDKRTYQQSFNSDDDSDDNENADNMLRKRTISRYASAPEPDISANELSVFSPLSLPFNDDTNINSTDDDEDINNDLPSQTNLSRSTPVSQQQPSSSSSSPFSLSFPSPSLLRSNTSLSEQHELLTTLPMSPLPLDQSLDLHVPYPVPRGTHIVDKFGP